MLIEMCSMEHHARVLKITSTLTSHRFSIIKIN